MDTPVGEIIAADTCQFQAECLKLYSAPPFGSFVRAEAGRSAAFGARTVYGVVAYIQTDAAETTRRTHALRMTPEELQERMPQLELVLRTCFAALVVGYADGEIEGSAERLASGLASRPVSGSRGRRPLCLVPPQPPEIHRFVGPASAQEVRALTEGPDCLRMLAQARPAGFPVPLDDLIAAVILHAAAARGAGSPAAEAFVVECGRYLAPLMRREFDRFEAIMRRLEAARATHPTYEQSLLS
jgi:hypothetical protein